VGTSSPSQLLSRRFIFLALLQCLFPTKYTRQTIYTSISIHLIILYYILYYIISYYIISYHVISYIISYRIILYYIISYYIISCHIIYRIIPYRIILYYIILYYIKLSPHISALWAIIRDVRFQGLYRAIHNSVTHFIQSVYLNGGKDCNTRPTDLKRNFPSSFCIPDKCSTYRPFGQADYPVLPITAAADRALLRWPPRSPDITPCNFFLWGYIKDSVFLPRPP
jgi:hypothetical protein